MVGPGQAAANPFGEIGDGRMLEAVELRDALIAFFQPKLLVGKRVLVTAGPTFEPIDPVRGLTNRSSGKMGFAIARAAAEAGATVVAVSRSKENLDEHVSPLAQRGLAVVPVAADASTDEGIATVIAHQSDLQLVATAANGKEAIEMFQQHQPDVTLMDLRLPDMSGISAIASIRAAFPEARIIMLTTFEGDVEVQRALAAGARGYLLKSTPLEDLVEVIRKVHAGRKHLPTQLAENLAEDLEDCGEIGAPGLH